jgi:hypothetical protein
VFGSGFGISRSFERQGISHRAIPASEDLHHGNRLFYAPPVWNFKPKFESIIFD